MNRYVGTIDGENVAITGETWESAMQASSLTYETKITSGTNFVGRLTDGRRYRIGYQARNHGLKFGRKRDASVG